MTIIERKCVFCDTIVRENGDMNFHRAVISHLRGNHKKEFADLYAKRTKLNLEYTKLCEKAGEDFLISIGGVRFSSYGLTKEE